jgi:hypothetical protein
MSSIILVIIVSVATFCIIDAFRQIKNIKEDDE